MTRHLIVLEEFEHPNDPRNYVVGGNLPLEFPQGKLVLGQAR